MFNVFGKGLEKNWSLILTIFVVIVRSKGFILKFDLNI
jgi:hypothetical protein